MLKKRIMLLGSLLVLCIVAQLLLRPSLGQGQGAAYAMDTDTGHPTEPSAENGDRDSTTEAPFADDARGLQSQLWRQFISMIGMVVIIGLGAWLVCRRFSCGPAVGRSQGRQIHIGETVRLGPRKALHLIHVGSKTFLVAGSGDSLSMLADVSDTVSDREGPGYE